MWMLKASEAPRVVTVRVYVVTANDLQPQDSNGGCDAYVVIHAGKRRAIKDSKNYVPANCNPVFGRSYDVEMTIPQETELTVALYDHDNLNSDDLVGETVIDIEDRLLARCEALNGLPQTFKTEGMDAWRFQQRPREMLQRLCDKHHFPAPIYSKAGDEPAWVKTWLPGASERAYFFCENLVLPEPVVKPKEKKTKKKGKGKALSKDKDKDKAKQAPASNSGRASANLSVNPNPNPSGDGNPNPNGEPNGGGDVNAEPELTEAEKKALEEAQAAADKIKADYEKKSKKARYGYP